MISDYIRAALNHAEQRYLEEDGLYYAEIPELPGLWASAEHEDDLQRELVEALEGWIVLKLQLGHTLPVIDGVSLAFEMVA